MDCNMPVMDGLEATKVIKNNMRELEYPKMIIVAITAYAFNETMKSAKYAGMSDFLTKPVTL